MRRSAHADMHMRRITIRQAPLSCQKTKVGHIYSGSPSPFSSSLLGKNVDVACCLKVKFPSVITREGLGSCSESSTLRALEFRCLVDGSLEESSDEDDELCPVECVREFKTDQELFSVLEKAKESNSLVVVDFYRTACGSCKYIEQGFAKLCRGAGEKEDAVIFLKHNVIDEYDEQSEVAERLRIKTVPLFHFYKNGVLLESFPTRDKERILDAILKYTASAARSL